MKHGTIISALREHRSLFLLGVLLMLSHWLFASRYLVNWDAGQFALGTVRYDLTMHQPHPPGYFLYVKAGALITSFTRDANAALLLVNFFFALAAVALLYWCVVQLTRNQQSAFITAMLCAVNPVFWYYHLVANTYIIEAFAVSASLAAAILVYQTKRPEPFIVNVIVLAVTTGFRPTVTLSCLPLLAAQAYWVRPRLRSLVSAGLLGAALFSAWFIPFTVEVGGWVRLRRLVTDQFLGAAAGVHNLNQLEFFWWSLLLMVNISFIFFLVRALRIVRLLRTGEWQLLIATLIWNLVLYLGLHFGEVGYLLSLLPLYLALLAPVIQPYATGVGWVAITVVLATNVGLFFSAQQFTRHPKVTKTSYATIREHDQRMDAHLAAVRAYPPERSLVIALRGDYFTPQKTVSAYPYDDIRILEYYLPNYQLYDIVGVRGEYFRAHDWRYERIYSDQIAFPRAVDRLVLLGDYLHPDVWPSEIKLTTSRTAHPSNYYVADIAGLNRFEFLGFSFARE